MTEIHQQSVHLRCPKCGRWMCAIANWRDDTRVSVRCPICKLDHILSPQEQSEHPVTIRKRW